MTDETDPGLPPTHPIYDTALILRAIRQAALDTLPDHQRTGDPVAVWRNGRVMWVKAEDIVVPDLTQDD